MASAPLFEYLLERSCDTTVPVTEKTLSFAGALSDDSRGRLHLSNSGLRECSADFGCLCWMTKPFFRALFAVRFDLAVAAVR